METERMEQELRRQKQEELALLKGPKQLAMDDEERVFRIQELERELSTETAASS